MNCFGFQALLPRAQFRVKITAHFSSIPSDFAYTFEEIGDLKRRNYHWRKHLPRQHIPSSACRCMLLYTPFMTPRKNFTITACHSCCHDCRTSHSPSHTHYQKKAYYFTSLYWLFKISLSFSEKRLTNGVCQYKHYSSIEHKLFWIKPDVLPSTDHTHSWKSLPMQIRSSCSRLSLRRCCCRACTGLYENNDFQTVELLRHWVNIFNKCFAGPTFAGA